MLLGQPPTARCSSRVGYMARELEIRIVTQLQYPLSGTTATSGSRWGCGALGLPPSASQVRCQDSPSLDPKYVRYVPRLVWGWVAMDVDAGRLYMSSTG